jgi:hypothetical protein
MKLKKLQSILMGLGIIILTLMDPLKASAQAYFGFPLTAQQIEYDEGDRFYVTFGYDFNWSSMVINSLQHVGPAKQIKVTQYVECSVFDELQMKETDAWKFVYNSKNHYWKRIFLNENVRHHSILSETPSKITRSKNDSPVIGAETKNEIEYNNTKIIYTRDQKKRVISATVKNYNNTASITKFEYLANSDYISSIKEYNGEGNLKYEVNYEYINIDGNPYLKKASHKIPTRYPNGTTEYEYTEYSFRYGKELNDYYSGKAYDIVSVKKYWFDQNQPGGKERTDEFTVSIDRYDNGDIKTVRCPSNPQPSYNGARMEWIFLEYDSRHNWTKMIVEDKREPEKRMYPKTQLIREIAYDQESQIHSASTSNPSPKADNIKGTSSIKNGNRFVVIDGSQLRLRLGPSTSSDTFKWPDGTNRHPNVGDKFRYLGEEGDFYKIDFNGNEVWVSKQYTHLE